MDYGDFRVAAPEHPFLLLLRETYVSYNLQKLDRLRDDEPDWLEYYSAELSENVPEAVATVVATPE